MPQMIVLDSHIWFWWINLEHHRDPFDRIIIATALELDARLASVDGYFVSYTELAGRLIGQ